MSITNLIAIDPGFNGGIACHSQHGIRIETMPIIITPAERTKKGKIKKKKKAIIDEYLLRELIVGMAGSKLLYCLVIIEDVHAMPHDGGVSGFNFGLGLGTIRGICSGIGIRYVKVLPTVWMKNTCGKKAHLKDKPSIPYCQAKYSHLDLRKNERCRTPHDGICDALCMLDWALQSNLEDY